MRLLKKDASINCLNDLKRTFLVKIKIRGTIDRFIKRIIQ